MTKAPVLLSLLSAVALVACGGDDVDDIGPGDALSSEQVSELCDRACVKLVECQPAQTPAACVAECSPFAGAYRGDLFVDLIECLEQHTCQALDDDDPCEALYDAVVPTETAQAFLAAMRAAEARCTATPFNRSSDDDIWPILNDRLLSDLTACTDDPCDQVDDCIGRLDVP